MSETGVPERYFYHSFPRRSRSTEREIASGLTILELIRDFGLLQKLQTGNIHMRMDLHLAQHR